MCLPVYPKAPITTSNSADLINTPGRCGERMHCVRCLFVAHRFDGIEPRGANRGRCATHHTHHYQDQRGEGHCI